MPVYVVSGYITASVVKEIEAKDELEAETLGVPSLCYQCSSAGGDSDDVWQLNELDGEPPDDCVLDVSRAIR